MAESMSMNRLIHAAVRRDLARFQNALADFPDSNQHRAIKLSTAWEFFRGELDVHHHGEHDIAWPALRAVGVSDDVLAEMDAEHERLAGALAAADEKMQALARTPSLEAATAVHAAIADLQGVVEGHFTHEERDVDPAYLAHRDAPVIKAMGRKFARRSPLRSGDFFAWLENGASPDERAALRDSVPPPVVAVFSRVLGQRYRRIVAPVWR